MKNDVPMQVPSQIPKTTKRTYKHGNKSNKMENQKRFFQTTVLTTPFRQNKGTHLHPTSFFNKLAYCNPTILFHNFHIPATCFLFYISSLTFERGLVERQNLQTSTQISWPKYILPA